MHGSHEVPRDPESDRRGHEVRDVAVRPILYFVIGLAVFGGVLQTVMSTIMQGYVAADTRAAVPSADILSDHGDTAKAPPLQRDTTADMKKMYAEEDAILTSFRKNKETGKVRIPIDRAIEVVVKRGLLTHRKDAPKGTADPELQYPKRSKPYQTTN